MSETEWTREWPTEPGWYWFYGRLSTLNGTRDGKPGRTELRPIQVFRCGDGGLAYSAMTFFIYESEGAEGWWVKAEIPELPED